jgi:SPP1 gp7 family putative phage head morphogenesis protein
MGAYNIHKRATLDRLTLTHQLMMREVLRRQTQEIAGSMKHALEHGLPYWHPNVKGLKDKIHGIFEHHQANVVKVAISDGIQEVSPEHKLSLWMEHPLQMPIEDTLTRALADKRDSLIDRYLEKLKDKKQGVLKALAESLMEDYLSAIRKSYKVLAGDWLSGGDTDPGEIKAVLGRALQVTDSSSERIFRTETTNYFNETRHAYFSANTAVDFMQLYALTDGRISHICETRHGFCMTIDRAGLKKYMPAFHPNCRTVQRALISKLTRDKALIDKGLAMDESSFAPLPKGWA